jgi:hypothetical protein
MKLINLTPHPITIEPAGYIAETIPPTAPPARVKTVTTQLGVVRGVPIVAETLGAVEGLPDPTDGVCYIVSGMVRAAVPDRADVLSPGALIRDDAGRVVGCASLIGNGAPQ